MHGRTSWSETFGNRDVLSAASGYELIGSPTSVVASLRQLDEREICSWRDEAQDRSL